MDPVNLCFKEKVVLVTGASSGIGETTAIEFAKRGADLAITGRNLPNLQKTGDKCAKYGKKPHLIQADLLVDEDVEKVLTSTIKHFGKLDILINNAGIFLLGGIQDTNMDVYDRTFQTNLRAVFKLTQLATPYLIETKGSVLNVSSVAGIRPFDAFIAYCMSKAALDQFTRCVAIELASKQVRVNSVAPGLINTDIPNRTGLSADQVQQFMEHQKHLHPLQRIGEPEEVTDLILFLSSDKAGFITGATVSIDGGYQATVPK